MARDSKATGRPARSASVRAGAAATSRTTKDGLMRAKMELVAARERGESGALGTLLAAHPALSAELVEFDAALIATTSYEADVLTPAVDALAERARARAFAAVFAAPQPASAPAAVAERSLTILRKARNLTQVGLAKRLGLGVDVVQGLERGIIRAATLPERLLRALGDALGTTAEQVQAIVQMQAATLPALNRIKGGEASDQPELDFAQAVRLSPNMTPEQKAQWLAE